METIIVFVKNYFLFLLVLYLISYLAPQESYRKYYRFFVCELMKPVLGFLQKDVRAETRRQLYSVADMLAQNEYKEKGEDVFAWFLEREGVDYEATERQE